MAHELLFEPSTKPEGGAPAGPLLGGQLGRRLLICTAAPRAMFFGEASLSAPQTITPTSAAAATSKSAPTRVQRLSLIWVSDLGSTWFPRQATQASISRCPTSASGPLRA